MELFEAAVEVKKKRVEGDISKSTYDFCFTSIIKCGECGRSYHGKQKTKVKYGSRTRNYSCAGKYRSEKCQASDISETKLTVLFLDFLKVLKFAPEVPEKVIGGRDTIKERKKLEKSLADSVVKKDRYTRAWGSNIIEYDKFLELMGEETEKQRKWQLELDEINMQTPTHKKKHSDVAKSIQDMGSNWENMTVLQRKMALYKVFKYMVIKKELGVWKIAAFLLN